MRKKIVQLAKATTLVFFNVLINFAGCMSSPSKNNRKMMPIFAMLLIKEGSSIKDAPEGPRRIPTEI
tara:strand:- start:579 stop:779 length:201 start_codon:yes stop_codon:yes gene_type:complete